MSTYNNINFYMERKNLLCINNKGNKIFKGNSYWCVITTYPENPLDNGNFMYDVFDTEENANHLILDKRYGYIGKFHKKNFK